MSLPPQICGSDLDHGITSVKLHGQPNKLISNLSNENQLIVGKKRLMSASIMDN